MTTGGGAAWSAGILAITSIAASGAQNRKRRRAAALAAWFTMSDGRSAPGMLSTQKVDDGGVVLAGMACLDHCCELFSRSCPDGRRHLGRCRSHLRQAQILEHQGGGEAWPVAVA